MRMTSRRNFFDSLTLTRVRSVGHRCLFYALGMTERPQRLFPIDSEMAGPIGLKLGGMVEGMCENDLAKEFF